MQISFSGDLVFYLLNMEVFFLVLALFPLYETVAVSSLLKFD